MLFLASYATAGRWSVQLNYPLTLLLIMFQKNVHAIGDRANGIVLNAFEAALKDINVTASRPRLEHAQIMTKADMARLGKLGGGSHQWSSQTEADI